MFHIAYFRGAFSTSRRGTQVQGRLAKSSDLSRNPSAVFAAAERGPVDITRRGGERFVLTLASDAERRLRAMAIATDLISVSLEGRELPLSERLRKPFPWVEFLSDRGQVAFANELLAVARACASRPPESLIRSRQPRLPPREWLLTWPHSLRNRLHWPPRQVGASPAAIFTCAR